MPVLKDFLRKKDKIAADAQQQRPQQPASNIDAPQFKFIRSTTGSEELIEIPSYPDTEVDNALRGQKAPGPSEHKHHFHFRKSSNADVTHDPTAEPETTPKRAEKEKRLSGRMHFRSHSRTSSAGSSIHIPSDLPSAPAALEPVRPGTSDAEEGGKGIQAANEQREAQWEERATVLAQANPLIGSERRIAVTKEARGRSRSPSISNQAGDESIQEAIRLHEAGDLGLSTAMFGRLGDPKGANNALAQVLYGLALRHGWGVPAEPEQAVHYLSLAASNSASVEREALAAGMKKGGAAKGELVLAIFELANCFRYGWGVRKDPVAARHYYETAANLGDTDAMEMVAWCYVEGFGGGKDKFTAARYLRLAEEKGHKTVGNSWIWKEKYANPGK